LWTRWRAIQYTDSIIFVVKRSTEGGKSMIQLTDEQVRDLEASDFVAIDPHTKAEYILVPRVEYERLKAEPYDTDDVTDEERNLLRSQMLDVLGWEGMEDYQDDEE